MSRAIGNRKVCSKCKEEKDIEEFKNNRYYKDGVNSWCRKCTNNYNKHYREHNKETVKKSKQNWYINNKDYVKNKVKKYTENNIEQSKESKKNWRIKNTELINKRRREERKNNPDKIRKQDKKKRQSGLYKLRMRLRSRINIAIKNGTKSDLTMKLIGCSLERLRNHLQKTAIKNEYLDFNINDYDGKSYHIDHIKPICSFNLSIPEQQKECFNWSNMRILKAEENMNKIKEDLQYINNGEV